MTSLGALLKATRQRLARAPFAPSSREALLLLAHVLDVREAQILAYPERAVTPTQAQHLERLLTRRLNGEPMAYLLGEREFYGRPFAVDSRVLIPRPETEHLVEAALALDLPPRAQVVDMGTGSGCIALTLALERPDLRVLAIDRSLGALVVARDNRARLADPAHPGKSNLNHRVTLAQADRVRPVRLARVDLLVSNPPYVDPADRPALSTEVTDHEPATALFAEDRGCAMIAHLLDHARHLRSGTPTVIEIGYGQGEWLRGAIDARPELRLEQLIDDYAGIPRTAVIRAEAT